MIKINNPHKKFVFSRGAGYEEAFYAIIRQITGCSQGKVSGGADYENDTFVIRTHYMGDSCQCKLCEFKRDFEEDHQHAESCFNCAWKTMDKEYKDHPQYNYAPPLKIARLEHERYLMKEFGIPLKQRKDAENICTCWYKEKMQKELGQIGFIADCQFNLPNFHYKPDGYKIWVYRNFFRDTFTNKKKELKEFKKMCTECRKSVDVVHEPVEISGEDVGGQF